MVAEQVQPMLFAGAAAETVVLDLCRVLIGDGLKDRGLMNNIVNGEQHIDSCQRGMWLTPGGPRPDGDPCSKRCLEAQAAISAAGRWLRDREGIV